MLIHQLSSSTWGKMSQLEDEMENGEGTFWYVMLDPLFEPTANVQHTDYLWLNIWGNKEDKDSGYARYAETGLQTQADTFSTCQRFPHSGREYRRCPVAKQSKNTFL